MMTLIGERNGRLWRFHWDGKTMTPFSDDEMESEQRACTEAWERAAVEIFNRADLPEPDTGDQN